MTVLGLIDPAVAEDAPIVIRRWVLRVVSSACVAIIVPFAGFQYRQDRRISALELAPGNAQEIALLKQNVQDIQAILHEYEELRVEREHQIAELQTKVAGLTDTLNQTRLEINGKLDRLLFRSR